MELSKVEHKMIQGSIEVREIASLMPDRVSKVSARALTLVSKGEQYYMGLEFECSRKTSLLNPALRELCSAIDDNQFKETVLFKVPEGECRHRYIGHCENEMKDKNLAECSYREMDRRKRPLQRSAFDAHAVDAAIETIKEFGEVSIASFPAGRLFGETVMMIKLFDRLRDNKINNAKITLSIIDYAYAGSIDKFSDPKPAPWFGITRKPSDPLDTLSDVEPGALEGALHGRAIKAFVRYMASCVPPTLSFTVRVFGHEEDYKTCCFANSDYKNHLLLGAHMKDHEGEVWKTFKGLWLTTQHLSSRAIAIRKSNSNTYLWKDGREVFGWKNLEQPVVTVTINEPPYKYTLHEPYLEPKSFPRRRIPSPPSLPTFSALPPEFYPAYWLVRELRLVLAAPSLTYAPAPKSDGTLETG